MLWESVQRELIKRHISIYRLSKITGIKQSTFQNYKNGSEPSFKNMCKVADVLNVSLDKFRGDD